MSIIASPIVISKREADQNDSETAGHLIDSRANIAAATLKNILANYYSGEENVFAPPKEPKPTLESLREALVAALGKLNEPIRDGKLPTLMGFKKVRAEVICDMLEFIDGERDDIAVE